MLLYETLSQPLIFAVISLIGFSSGLIFDLRNYICFLFAKNKIVSITLDVVATILVCLIFLIGNLYFNFGEFRVYVILAFIIGLLIERVTLGIIVGKICSWCYNKFRKLVLKIYGRRENKKESSINS